MGLFEELEWRGMVQDSTEGLRELLGKQKVSAYIGFDPTADSLHVGSLLPLTTLARIQRAGHRAIALVGGATGMIGDPSGKSKERNLLDEEQLAHNVSGIESQIRRYLDFEGDNPASLVNNLDWLGPFRMVDFLRDVGKHFTVNYMIAKESVKRRLGSEAGISYTEFSYLVLQSYDFLELFEQHGVTLQVGGSDQWGNITAGIDLIRARKAAKAHGLTFPLVRSASGVKFGKTEEGAVWLDPNRTSPYRFYQFWMNTSDEDVLNYLKYFTFLEREEVGELEKAHAESPQQRTAHRKLAEEVTRLVHGDEGLERALSATQVFFGAAFDDLEPAQVMDVFADVPSGELPRERFSAPARLIDILVESGFLPSKKEARRSIEGGGLSVNNHRVTDVDATLDLEQAIGGELFVFRKGKRSYHVVRISPS